jgi:hypothetical protein
MERQAESAPVVLDLSGNFYGPLGFSGYVQTEA